MTTSKASDAIFFWTATFRHLESAREALARIIADGDRAAR